jgi:PKD repeat protein
MTIQEVTTTEFSINTTEEKLILAVRENDLIERDGRTARAKNVKCTFNSNGTFKKSFTADFNAP